MTQTVLGIIAGSGVQPIEQMENIREMTISGPWGDPSGPILAGTLHGVEMRFLARHGQGHSIPPSAVNYRANIDGLKRAGVTDVISVSACGSFREHLPPGTFVIVDQFIDRTHRRENSFFGHGLVAHVSMADPVCPRLGDKLEQGCRQLDIPVQRGGVYLAMEGPQFSSRAESHMYRSWGCDVIGMTNMPEAKLAREAELPYATVAMVTDYDCWHETEDAVEVSNVLQVLMDNGDKARQLVAAVAPMLGPKREPSPLGIETCLDYALITAPEVRDPALLAKLDAVAGRLLS